MVIRAPQNLNTYLVYPGIMVIILFSIFLALSYKLPVTRSIASHFQSYFGIILKGLKTIQYIYFIY